MRSAPYGQMMLIYLMVSGVVLAQVPDERSITQPTKLDTMVASGDATVTKVGRHTLVAGADSVANFSAVEIEMPGEDGQRGVLLLLSQADKVGQIYLDLAEAYQLMDEIAGFQNLYVNDVVCGARNACIHGVARCRPSQTEAQAICPSYYIRPDGSQGLRISMQRHTFEFPFVEPTVFVESIVFSIGRHNSYQPDRELIQQPVMPW